MMIIFTQEEYAALLQAVSGCIEHALEEEEGIHPTVRDRIIRETLRYFPGYLNPDMFDVIIRNQRICK